MTLSYELHRDAAPDPTADLLLLRAEGLRRAFRGLLEDPAALPEGAQLGFECKHLYEEKALSGAEKALEKAEQKGLSSSSSSSKKAPPLLSVKKDLKLLKNEDAVTACAAAAAGLSVSFYRVLSESCCGDSEWVLPKMPTAARFGKKRRVDGGYMAKGITDDEIDDVSSVEEGNPRDCTSSFIMAIHSGVISAPLGGAVRLLRIDRLSLIMAAYLNLLCSKLTFIFALGNNGMIFDLTNESRWRSGGSAKTCPSSGSAPSAAAWRIRSPSRSSSGPPRDISATRPATRPSTLARCWW